MKREIKWIVVHHTLTSDGIVVNWDAIRRYHVHTNGWQDIGYHFGLEKAGRNYEILVGRPLNIMGAHTKCLNRNSVGIAIVGNFDRYPPTRTQINKLVKYILKPLMIYLDVPVERVIGHREAFIALQREGASETCIKKYNRKSCPGWRFKMASLRDRLVREGMPIHDHKLLQELDEFDKKATTLRKVFW